MAKCILVVDDDEMNLRRTKIILQKDFEVVLVESAKEALDKLKSQKFDLILLDIEMPGMSGIDMFQHIQKLHYNVPVIFLTASGDQDNVMKAIKLGAVNYVKKPFIPKELLERVRKVLE